MSRYEYWIRVSAPTLMLAILSWLLVGYGPLRPVENALRDLQTATMTPHQPPSPNIAILAITEDTLAHFPYRSPINRAFLAHLVEVLNKKGVRAIGLDILLDQPTEPDADRALQHALGESAVPVVVAYAGAEHLTPKQQRVLETFTAGLQRGYVDLQLDGADGVVRTIYAGRTAPDGAFVPGFAVALAGIPRPAGNIPLRYRGLPEGVARGDLTRAFKHYPAHTVDVIPRAWLEGKIVLIGAKLPKSGDDMHKTPYVALLGTQQGQMPGVMIQSHALSQLLEGTHPLPVTLWITLGLYLVAAMIGVAQAHVDWSPWLIFGLASGLLILFWWFGFWWYGRTGTFIPLLGPSLTLLGAGWWSYVQASREARARQRFIQGAFSRYLHPEWVRQLVEHPDMLRLRGERREVSILFTDIAGFTTLSETLPPTALVDLLSRYLEGMTDTILAHGGSIDKYLGDGIMVLFGAPAYQPDHALRAVRCALALDAFGESFRQQAAPQGEGTGTFGITRIGVHTGEATVGNFGSTARLEYTAIGDVVNTASRLEGCNRYFGTRVAVSAATHAQALGRLEGHDIGFRPMGHVRVKGKREEIQAFNPFPASTRAADSLPAFLAAYSLLDAGDPAAIERLAALHDEHPEDGLIAFLLGNARAGELTTHITFQVK